MDLKKQRMHHLCLLHPYGHNKRIVINNIIENIMNSASDTRDISIEDETNPFMMEDRI